jgi:hypothetical protein
MTPQQNVLRRLAVANLVLMAGFPLLIAGAVTHVRALVVAGAVLVALLAVLMIVVAPVTLARRRD